MNIAFIHYHMNTGGVTTVINRQAESVNSRGDVMVLTGQRVESDFPFEVVYIPGLGYDGESANSLDPSQIAQTICDVIYTKWARGCDLIHVHNATLTKNRNILCILKELQIRGMRLFIQIHDFAEDGRPLIYSPEEYVADCHYGVINSRDYNLLLNTGLKKEGLHFMPNPCRTYYPSNNQQGAQKYVLYPVRAIRRKNPGEAILTSLFLKDDQTLAISQPPDETAEMACYHDWKAFCESGNLKVAFEEGTKQNFDELWSGSDFILTTSISEGFGLIFVDAWSTGKLLWGRYLPNVCGDFEKNDINLNHLYRGIKIPIEWIDLSVFHHKWITSLETAFQRFGRQVDEPLIAGWFKRTLSNGQIDFGMLDERMQKQIITFCQTDSSYKNCLSSLNPFLAHPGYVRKINKLIARNQKATLNQYNQRQYRNDLMNRYTAIRDRPVKQRINKERLLDSILQAEKFSLLKWARYEA